jgi:hypothetical protein
MAETTYSALVRPVLCPVCVHPMPIGATHQWTDRRAATCSKGCAACLPMTK